VREGVVGVDGGPKYERLSDFFEDLATYEDLETNYNEDPDTYLSPEHRRLFEEGTLQEVRTTLAEENPAAIVFVIRMGSPAP
jgi:hypothetical protein